LCVDPEQLRVVLDVLEARGVPSSRIGVAGGDRLVVKGQFDLPLAQVTTRYRDCLPEALGAGTTQG
jgi:phosphoribosylformylglycinamidine synthase subunit PurL